MENKEELYDYIENLLEVKLKSKQQNEDYLFSEFLGRIEIYFSRPYTYGSMPSELQMTIMDGKTGQSKSFRFSGV